ncbi:hypothetical protein EDC01DRAFT_636296 [Geopyxis carbonaria]|nr:hypothetical protein EDC01DRAFT_636296 [Geopyxis carbonaria]
MSFWNSTRVGRKTYTIVQSTVRYRNLTTSKILDVESHSYTSIYNPSANWTASFSNVDLGLTTTLQSNSSLGYTKFTTKATTGDFSSSTAVVEPKDSKNQNISKNYTGTWSTSSPTTTKSQTQSTHYFNHTFTSLPKVLNFTRSTPAHGGSLTKIQSSTNFGDQLHPISVSVPSNRTTSLQMNPATLGIPVKHITRTKYIQINNGRTSTVFIKANMNETKVLGDAPTSKLTLENVSSFRSTEPTASIGGTLFPGSLTTSHVGFFNFRSTRNLTRGTFAYLNESSKLHAPSIWSFLIAFTISVLASYI